MAHPDMSHISFTSLPAASVGCYPLNYLLCNQTHPYSIILLTIGSGYFQAKPSPLATPTILRFSHYTYLPAYEDGTDSVFQNVGI